MNFTKKYQPNSLFIINYLQFIINVINIIIHNKTNNAVSFHCYI